MTEPQELRSIDELFRNTFNNLPDTPADTGWDTPSKHVWQQVQNNMQAPPPSSFGMSLFLIVMVAMQASVLILPLLFATPKQKETTPANPTVIIAPTATVPTALPQVTETTSTLPEQESVLPKKVSKPKQVQSAERPIQPTENVNHEGELLRPGGAAPLPGSNTDLRPNTTEKRKAERARQLEQLWHKPLELLPVPKNRKEK